MLSREKRRQRERGGEGVATKRTGVDPPSRDLPRDERGRRGNYNYDYYYDDGDEPLDKEIPEERSVKKEEKGKKRKVSGPWKGRQKGINNHQ